MDRPIIFSAPMVRALLAGTKTQTRRLASSPLRHTKAGDRLWVKENHRLADCPCPEACRLPGNVYYDAGWNDHDRYMTNRLRPSIFMPRWASRLTLIVTQVRIERLQAITEADCIAEGPKVRGWMEGLGRPLDGWMVETDQPHVSVTPRWWYRDLWGSLHTKEGERWDDNPQVVALTFSVARWNIGEEQR